MVTMFEGTSSRATGTDRASSSSSLAMCSLSLAKCAVPVRTSELRGQKSRSVTMIVRVLISTLLSVASSFTIVYRGVSKLNPLSLLDETIPESAMVRPDVRRLNYQHLLYFWTVVREGSITRASEVLHLSAPAISAQLKTLEARLGEKLLEKSGRTLAATEAGQVVYRYAEEIFGLGRDLLATLAQRPTSRPLRFIVGIDDVLPKEIAYRLLDPALRIAQPVHLVCHEGTLERLTVDLAAHDVDVVLSDAPMSPRSDIRAYNHPLGRSDVLWMAPRAVARKLLRGFPQSLTGAPILLPTDDTAIRRSLDQWLDRRDVRPVPIGEFDDYALLREFARAGHGIAPVPAVLAGPFRDRYGFETIGRAEGVEAQFFAISLERKIRHPALAAVMEQAPATFPR